MNSYGKKGFSQTDEDGITLEIIKRMGIKKGIFAEFGAGDALSMVKWNFSTPTDDTPIPLIGDTYGSDEIADNQI